MKLPYNHIEIVRTTSSSGTFTRWVVRFYDLYFGWRHLATFYTRAEAVRAAQQLARDMRVPFQIRTSGFDRRSQPRPNPRLPTKRELFEQRQRRIAQRAAKRNES
jgi:plasmid stabilization system protein ParE